MLTGDARLTVCGHFSLLSLALPTNFPSLALCSALPPFLRASSPSERGSLKAHFDGFLLRSFVSHSLARRASPSPPAQAWSQIRAHTLHPPPRRKPLPRLSTYHPLRQTLLFYTLQQTLSLAHIQINNSAPCCSHPLSPAMCAGRHASLPVASSQHHHPPTAETQETVSWALVAPYSLC